MEIIGNFFGVQDINILMKLFNKINETNEPFILISTGSSYVKINNICAKLKNISHIIIFCMHKYKYIHFLNEINSKVKLVSDNIYEINNFLKSTIFPSFNLTISEEIDNKPFISFYEYKNYYYLLHKILSFFFLENFSNLEFSYDYMQKVFNYINYHINLSFDERNQLNKKIEKLYTSNNFLKDSLKLYTSEKFYHFNKTKRKIELGVARLSFLIGPMYYSMLRFVYLNGNNYILNKDTILYRIIYVNEYNLNNFYMSKNNIICFPSFSSSSFTEKFETTNNEKKVNNICENDIKIKMKLIYNHNSNNVPIGMILKEFSIAQHENEVLLFPFTFIKVDYLIEINKKYYKLKGTIINKD